MQAAPAVVFLADSRRAALHYICKMFAAFRAAALRLFFPVLVSTFSRQIFRHAPAYLGCVINEIIPGKVSSNNLFIKPLAGSTIRLRRRVISGTLSFPSPLLLHELRFMNVIKPTRLVSRPAGEHRSMRVVIIKILRTNSVRE